MSSFRTRLVRWCLRLVGFVLPEEYRDELLHELRKQWRDRESRGGSALAFLLREIPGALRHGIRDLLDDAGAGLGHPTDLLHAALRRLRSDRGAVVAGAAVLAVGVGVSTAVFSVVDAVLLAPLPYEDPGRLVRISFDQAGADPFQSIAAGELREIRTKVDAIGEAGGVHRSEDVVLTADDRRLRVTATDVTPGLFAMLGVEPAAGRLLAEEDAFSGGRVVVSHGFATAELGGLDGAVGQVLRLGSGAVEVVGVLPPDFVLRLPAAASVPADVDVWLADDMGDSYWVKSVRTVARLSPGAGIGKARQELETLMTSLESRFPELYGELDARFVVTPLKNDLVGDVRTTILLLFGAVGLILIIGCGNAALLFLLSTLGRRGEIAVRRALGAGAGRLAIETVTFGVLVGAAAGAAGVGVAQVVLTGLLRMAPAGIPRLEDAGLDVSAFLFLLGTSVLVGGSTSVLPALSAARTGPASHLRRTRHSTAGGMLPRRLLVTGQVALTFLLLGAGVLLVESLREAGSVDPGFRPANVLTFQITPPDRIDDSPGDARMALYRDLLGRLGGLPGVTAAAAGSHMPYGGRYLTGSVAWDEASLEDVDRNLVDARFVTPGYVKALGLELIAGRGLEWIDAPRPVVLVDEALAERAFPGGDAVGRELVVPFGREREIIRPEIVGVVAANRPRSVRGDRLPQIYYPAWMRPAQAYSVFVRGEVAPSTIRRTVDEVGALPVFATARLSSLLDEDLRDARFSSGIMLVLAAMGLLVTVAGLYSSVAYLARQRRAEFGVRMALGATPGSIETLVLREGVGMTALGLSVGLVAATLVFPAFESLLFGVRPLSIPVLGGSAAGLAAVAVVASWLPARRARTGEPVAVLRA